MRTCSKPRRKANPLLDHPVSLMKPVKTKDGVAWTGAQAARAMIVATTVEMLIRAKVAVIRSRMRTRKIYGRDIQSGCQARTALMSHSHSLRSR